jgi:diamine N-acetyltransferase
MSHRRAVQLRDIVTEADRAAALSLRTAPGQDQFVADVDQSFADALEHPEACARSWAVYDGDTIVGFAMISDDIPQATLDADPTLAGPYYLWRLLIDERHQRRGYGTATLDAVADYVRRRPNGDALITSASQGEGGPQPFYERYGFVPTGELMDGEVVLRLDLRGESARGLGA